MDTRADVVVVGGGVIGAAVTYYLARQRVKVCLLERGDIASGTSGAAANGVALQTKPPGPKQDLARASATLFHDLTDELDTDIGYANEGGMLVAETDEQMVLLREKAKRGARSGLRIEVLTAEETLARQSALARHVTGATYCAEDSTANPYLLAFGFVRAARRLGATIRTGVEVTGIERRGEKIAAVLTNAGKVMTDTVVNAAGPWSPQLARMVDVNLPVEPRKGELFVTAPGPPILSGVVISASYLLSKSLSSAEAAEGRMTVGLFASQTRRGNLLIGSTREFSGYGRQSSYRGMHALAKQMAKLIPSAANRHVLRFYAGLRPSTPDGLPILGRSAELPGFIIATGHEGDGIALSPISGKLIADLITNQIDKETLAPFAPNRFNQAWN